MTLPDNLTKEQIEVERLKLEERQVLVEERKAKQGFLTRLGIVVPLIVAVFVFGGNLVVQRIEAHDALEAEKRDARDAFELKVAELIMDANGPYETRGRAVAMAQLFPNRVPNDFTQNYNPEQAMDRQSYERDQRVASKKTLISLLAAHPGDAKFIVRTWRQLFPGDAWTKAIVNGTSSGDGSSTGERVPGPYGQR